VVRERAAGDFRLTDTTHPPALRLARHAHAWPAATFVLEGSFTETLAGVAFPCGPSSVLWKPAREPHADRYGPRGARCLIVERQAGAESPGACDPGPLDRAAFLPAALAGDLAARLDREFRAPGGPSALAVAGLLADLLRRADLEARRGLEGEPRAWLTVARDFLHRRFAEPIRVRDVARAAGVHPVHLARAFRREYGRAPGDYLRDLRLAWARQALAQGSRPLARIALEAGFADQSHFSRVFKRAFGTSPRRFRTGLQSCKTSRSPAAHARVGTDSDPRQEIRP
jgi:AraC family transcriptional regulator